MDLWKWLLHNGVEPKSLQEFKERLKKMFFWGTGEMGAWSYPAQPPSPFKAVSLLLKQPDATTLLQPLEDEALWG